MLASAKLQTLVLTSRIEETGRFYRDVLQLPFKGISHGAWVFEVGGGDLRVSPVPATQPTEHTVLGFSVPDVKNVVNVLSERGIEWVRFPNFPHDETGILTTPDGARVAWFRDPDGNLLSVVEYRNT